MSELWCLIKLPQSWANYGFAILQSKGPEKAQQCLKLMPKKPDCTRQVIDIFRWLIDRTVRGARSPLHSSRVWFQYCRLECGFSHPKSIEKPWWLICIAGKKRSAYISRGTGDQTPEIPDNRPDSGAQVGTQTILQTSTEGVSDILPLSRDSQPASEGSMRFQLFFCFFLHLWI